MSILVHVAADGVQLPAPDLNPDLVAARRPIPKLEPTRLALHEQQVASAAIHHARRLYPGPAGEILVEAIAAYKEFGYLAQPSASVARLIRELTS